MSAELGQHGSVNLAARQPPVFSAAFPQSFTEFRPRLLPSVPGDNLSDFHSSNNTDSVGLSPTLVYKGFLVG